MKAHPTDLDLGLRGQHAAVPIHIGLFYAGAGDLGELFDFVRVAVANPQEAVIVFGSEGGPRRFLRSLEQSLGRSLDIEISAGRLISFEGDPDPDTQLTKVVRAITSLAEKGASVVRVVALVAWDAPKWPAAEDFLWLESRFDAAFAALPVAMICAYDITSMPGPGLIYAGIESHRFLSIGGKVAANQLAVPPDAYLTDRLLRLPWLTRERSPIEADALGERREVAASQLAQTTGVEVTQGIRACASCGLAVEGGTEGCQRLFESIGLREYEDMRFGRYHRIVVDVYAMQHPDRYGRSAKSFAAHLTGLCAWLDSETDAPLVNAAVQRWLSGPSPIEKPALPTGYGDLTIRDLVNEDDVVAYGEVLRRWAGSTWDAYAPLHATARAWIATSLAHRTG